MNSLLYCIANNAADKFVLLPNNKIRCFCPAPSDDILLHERPVSTGWQCHGAVMTSEAKPLCHYSPRRMSM